MNTSDETILEVDQLSVAYEQMPALWDLSFKIPPGKMVAIIGPNGAGKSTLLSTLVQHLTPTSGCFRFWGREFEDVRGQIAYVPQRESVDWEFPITVHQLVMMGRFGHLGWFKRPKSEDEDLVRQALERVELINFSKRQISQLSGGQRQRIFIARALAQQADLYLMDEPFAAVDLGTEKRLVNLMKELTNEGKSIFIVHHDLNSVREYFDWVIMLNVRLVAYGPVETTFTTENITRTYGKPVTLLEQITRAVAEVKS